MRGIDLSGQRFSMLTVISRLPKSKWLCICDCGKEARPKGYVLKAGRAKSCGCFRKIANVAVRTTHGQSYTKLYRRWASMIRRCSDLNYDRYGGRGISVCDEWRVFENFARDMGEPPAGKTLDRIDNNGNYEPSNCRWATVVEQNRNRRSNNLVTHNGETKCVTEWAEKYGIRQTLLRDRLLSGMRFEDAVSMPVKISMSSVLRSVNGGPNDGRL